MEDLESSSSRSMESVISNDYLLTEILVRSPFLSLVFFRTVSKRWNSLITRSKIYPPSRLLVKKRWLLPQSQRLVRYDSVPLDIHIPFTFGPKLNGGRFEILHSCNGLLLCRRTYAVTLTYKCGSCHVIGSFDKLYVYNPSFTNRCRELPKLKAVACYQPDPGFGGGLILAFDPTKSPQYKVIYAEVVVRFPQFLDSPVKLHIFSSETGNWSLCEHRFRIVSFPNFEVGVYWNDAIYWPDGDGKIFKLDIMNEDHPVLTLLSVDVKVHLCSPYESRGRLLAFCMEDECFRDFSIYEKRSVCSEWSVKYVVKLDDIIYPFREMWRPFCIVLGETEEDSFLVMTLDKKVVLQYKIMSNTLSTISDLGQDRYNSLNCFHVIPSFANV